MSAAPYQFFDLSSHKSLLTHCYQEALCEVEWELAPASKSQEPSKSIQHASCTVYHVYSVLGVLLVGVEKLRIFLVSSPSELIRLLCLRRIKI